MKLYENAESALLKSLARDSFKHFIQATFPTYSFNWHHLYIIEKLEAFARGDIKKLMLFVPPQHGKSELVSRRFPAWLLGRNPNLKVVGCSYAIDLARKFNRSVQRIIDDKEYAGIFPETRLSNSNMRLEFKNASSKGYMRNTDEFEIVDHEGSFKSVGVAGPLTGNPMDIGIIDDPVKDQMQASSKTFRNRNWEWYNDVFLSRTHNDSQLLFTMTRWHEDDLAGRILVKESDWEVIRFPAIAEEVENGNDPRETGEALWPERHNIESLLSKKSNSSRTWASLYQQRPAPESGDIFKRDWFQTASLNPDHFRTAMKIYIDGAYTDKKTNDPTCIAIYFKHLRKVYVVKMINVRLTFEDLKRKIVELVGVYGHLKTTTITIEGKGPGISLVQSLKKDPQYRFLRIKQDNIPHIDKEARAHSTAGFIERGDYLLCDGEWSEYIEQMCAFPNAKHDDMVDCTTAIIRLELLKGGDGYMQKG